MEQSCPAPYNEYDKITLAHGSGGKLSDRLIHDVIVRELGDSYIDSSHDGAILDIPGRIAFTTDSFVVNPLFFPGGNIGDLAVNGTVNDLVCCGAIPQYLSLALIIEEGFPVADLASVMSSVAEAARMAGVKIVTGDTKVVEKGKGDKLFINTAGVGIVPEGRDISPFRCQAGDAIIISGTIADHGIAILSTREGLKFETDIFSDTAPLNALADLAFASCENIHVMRDPTRGGVASSLNEISKTAGKQIIIDEASLPLNDQVKGACEIMGFDPLYLANEGKLLFFVPEADAGKLLTRLRSHPLGRKASIIGRVEEGKPMVKMTTVIGSTRIVDMITGEQLPRIC
ncbi:MAG: hydrogenase expression/formation protein HypE [Bacteroidales bacterium]|nr:hydrogenase expression/formation protein HypE [Bacteroidales bacterium]